MSRKVEGERSKKEGGATRRKEQRGGISERGGRRNEEVGATRRKKQREKKAMKEL